MHAVVHPSMRPGAIIGYRKNGTPIRLIAGGNGEGDGDSDTGQDGAGTGDSQQAGNQEPSGDEPGSSQGDPGTSTGQQDTRPATQGDDSAARTIAAVRDDFKKERAQRQALQQQLADLQAASTRRDEETKARNLALAKALGVATDEPPDPEQLAKDLAAAREQTAAEVARAQARERELTVELELLKQARRHGADPELLVDSRSFMRQLGSLDPASEDFATDLGEAIKAAVEANPGYKLGSGATASGGSSGTSNAAGSGSTGTDGGAGDGQGGKPSGSKTTAPPARSGTGEGHNGAPGGNRQWTDEDVQRASPKEVREAQRAGLLAGLGIGAGKSRR